MTGMTDDLGTRHGFLQALHALLQPRIYLEVGVQYGTSLKLAEKAQIAIGIDPNPLVAETGNQYIWEDTSDDFFQADGGVRFEMLCHSRKLIPSVIDLAFIDGMHLAEYAWRDYENIRYHCAPNSVVVFDDVLPRNVHEARRIPVGDPVVGDWTGDVWKMARAALPGARTQILVDTWPTGLLVCTGFEPQPRPDAVVDPALVDPVDPPQEILNRARAVPAQAALQILLDVGAGRR